MIWVNIDKPTKKITIHTDPNCIYIPKGETPYKGIERLKRDGGWLSFSTLSEAQDYCNNLNFNTTTCC